MSDKKHQRRDDRHPDQRLNWDDTPPAGTTQQVKHGDVPSIEITLRQAEALVDVFGGHDAEVSIIERPDAWPHLDLGLYAYFTEYPGEGTIYLGPTEVDDDLAANGRAPAAPIRTWRERIGQAADFPLHAPTDVERAMEAEIAELRAQFVPPAANLVRIGGLMANVMYNLAQQAGKPLAARDCEIMDKLRKDWDEARGHVGAAS